MFNLQRAKKSPTIFRHLTDITPQAFEELMTVLKETYPEFERKKVVKEGKGNRCRGKVQVVFGREGLYDPFLSSPLSYLCPFGFPF